MNPKPLVKVELTKSHFVDEFEHQPGAVLEMSPESANWLIKLDKAKPYTEPKLQASEPAKPVTK